MQYIQTNVTFFSTPHTKLAVADTENCISWGQSGNKKRDLCHRFQCCLSILLEFQKLENYISQLKLVEIAQWLSVVVLDIPKNPRNIENKYNS